MNPFEFVFSLFGLLLGLSLAEVLGGFARTLKARRDVRIGWLTPMLGLFLMLHLTLFLFAAWQVRDSIPATFTALAFGLLVTGTYYLGASLVFPSRPGDWPTLDDYFFQHKRQVLCCAFAADGFVIGGQRALASSRLATDDFVNIAVGGLVMVLAIFVRGKWANTAVLAVLLIPFVLRIAHLR